MKRRITKEMVMELNESLKALGCPFEYEYDEDRSIRMELRERTFLDSYILNISRDGYEFVKRFFLEKGINITCNNTASIIWETYL